MGLGLHGGGLATARFLSKAGAEVTVTDTKTEEALAESLAALAGLPIRYVLGRHELADFTDADLVIKNPAVRPDSPFLLASKAIETDLSLFLRFSEAPIIAVTGSKGKSTASSALHHGLLACGNRAFLGGNITVSPLAFIGETSADTPVVLELSSWQLADLRGLGALRPRVALLTSIMPDHMNRYSSMDEYVADKRLIYADQDRSCHTILNREDLWSPLFAAETKGAVSWYSDDLAALGRNEASAAWLEGRLGIFAMSPDSAREIILPEELLIPGRHQRKNLLGAALALRLFGLPASGIAAAMSGFHGVEHRLEAFAESMGVAWYNDSAATIPQAVAAALESFDEPVVLITGGTDKNLDFEPVRSCYHRPKVIVLLAGSGTEKLRDLLDADGLAYSGPFDSLEEAVREAAAKSEPGDRVILSPGCTSFGMFLHEFDRGKKFKETVRRELGLGD
jgi:UDP-N-acetylmuramoylalanine--D-glutamate ligase